MNGIIVKNISNDYTVDCNGKYYICKPRGLFRINGKSPLVGDHVTIDEKNNYIFLRNNFHVEKLSKEDLDNLNKLLNWWTEDPYDHYNEWLSETYDTLKKAGR